MSAIDLLAPPHLQKRKRTREDDGSSSPPSNVSRRANDDEIHLDHDQYVDTKSNIPKPQRIFGPSFPPSLEPNKDGISLDKPDSDPDGDDTGPVPRPSRRIMGPAPPPGPLSELPHDSPESSSDSDDSFGPALPGAATARDRIPTLPTSSSASLSRRDDWMLTPPVFQGYRVTDTTKLKNRKFASGRAATSNPPDLSAPSTLWTETPKDKARRIKDAVLGRDVSSDHHSHYPSSSLAQTERDQCARVERSAVQTGRGRSLMEEHAALQKARKQKDTDKDDDGDDDDPSKRAFDREKDMRLGGRISGTQRRELLKRAGDFRSRFQTGKFL